MKINSIIRHLILADLAFWTGWGLVSPVFSIFIIEKIIGGTALVAGIAAAAYWITKSILEFPVGMLLDRYAGDKDDYFCLVAGFFIASIIPLAYIFTIYPWHIYLLQFFFGIGMAMAIAGWRAIFTRNIDKGKEGTEWALDDTLLGLGVGASGIFSGLLVVKIGFNYCFVAASFLGLIGVLVLIILGKKNEQVFGRGMHANLRDIFNNRKK